MTKQQYRITGEQMGSIFAKGMLVGSILASCIIALGFIVGVHF